MNAAQPRGYVGISTRHRGGSGRSARPGFLSARYSFALSLLWTAEVTAPRRSHGRGKKAPRVHACRQGAGCTGRSGSLHQDQPAPRRTSCKLAALQLSHLWCGQPVSRALGRLRHVQRLEGGVWERRMTRRGRLRRRGPQHCAPLLMLHARQGHAKHWVAQLPGVWERAWWAPAAAALGCCTAKQCAGWGVLRTRARQARQASQAHR